MIELKNITFSYKTFSGKKINSVFENLNISFEENKIHLITGENGSGKTTLIKLISGFLVPDSGDLLLDSKVIDYRNFPYNRFGVLLNFQRAFYWQLSVIDNIKFFLKINGIKFDAEKFNQLVDIFNFNHRFIKTPFGKLSTGNMLKANLIKTFMSDSKYILLDEPFSNLDNTTSESFKNYIQKIKNGKTLIISSNITEGITADSIFEINSKNLIEKK